MSVDFNKEEEKYLQMDVFECSVCTQSFKLYESHVSLSCGHCYHEDCLLQWLQRSETCPDCRSATLKSDIRRIYLNIVLTEDPKVLHGRINSLKADLAQKRIEIKDLNALVNKYRQEKNDVLRRMQTVKQSAETLKDSLNSIQSSVSEEKALNGYLKKELQSEQVERRRLSAEITSLRTLEASTSEAMKLFMEKAQRLESRCKTVEEENRELQERARLYKTRFEVLIMISGMLFFSFVMQILMKY